MPNKKITKLIVGTNNKGKLREIRDLLPKNLRFILLLISILKVQWKTAKLLKRTHLLRLNIFQKKLK